MDDVVYIEVSVDKNNSVSGIKRIILSIRPEWNSKDLKIEELKYGIINQMFLCYVKEQLDEDALIVRIYGPQPDYIINRDNEILGWMVANKAGVSPKLHAVFQNGLVVGYFPGQPLTWKQMSDPEFIRDVTQLLAKLHHTIPDVSSVSIGNKHISLPSKPGFYPRMRTSIEKMCWHYDDPDKQNRFEELLTSKEDTLQEVAKLEAFIASLDLPVVWCHNDIHQMNIIHNDITGKYSLIDYDHNHWCYGIADLSRIFMDFQFFRYVEFVKEDDNAFTDETVMLWVREYLSAGQKLRGDHQVLTESEVEHNFQILQKFARVNEFWWGLWLLSGEGVATKPDVDDFGLAEVLLKAYKKNRKILFP